MRSVSERLVQWLALLTVMVNPLDRSHEQWDCRRVEALYRSLDPSRLRLTGRGQWNCEEYLGDLFWLVFKEPRLNCFDILPPSHMVPDVTKESKEKVFDMCRIWDQQGLLEFCPPDLLAIWPAVCIPCLQQLQVPVRRPTNRGYRRGQNFREGILHGQSRKLPYGITLLQINPVRFSECLIGAVTDRRDFYHQLQFSVSSARATTNFLYPFPSWWSQGVLRLCWTCRRLGKDCKEEDEEGKRWGLSCSCSSFDSPRWWHGGSAVLRLFVARRPSWSRDSHGSTLDFWMPRHASRQGSTSTIISISREPISSARSGHPPHSLGGWSSFFWRVRWYVGHLAEILPGRINSASFTIWTTLRKNLLEPCKAGTSLKV